MGEYDTRPIDEKLVKDLLEEAHPGQQFHLTQFNVEMAVSEGENYSSTVHRLRVSYELDSCPQESCFIVKTLPPSGIVRDFIVASKIFDKETLVYKATLPAMHSLIRNCGLKQVGKFAPRAFETKRGDVVALEDLQPLGYRLCDRRAGLDVEHCRVALTKLAVFHAASIALRDEETAVVKKHRFCEADNEFSKTYLPGLLNTLATCVDRWSGFERFGEKLRQAATSVCDRLKEITSPQKDDALLVLNHGDFWINNIMFRYSEDGSVENVAFLDFQLCNYASPAVDLNYFLYTSASDIVRWNHFDQLLEEYRLALCEALEVMGCGHFCISNADLKEEIRRKSFFGLFTACTKLSLIVTEEMQDESVNGEDVYATSLIRSYQSNAFRKCFEPILLRFERENLL